MFKTTHRSLARFGRLATIAALVAGVAGCASQTSVSGQWAEGAPRDRTFNRVLVVGVSPNLRQRCAFERYLVNQIGNGSTQAFASCDSMEPSQREPLTRESIDKAVARQQADAVVATVLVTKSMQVDQGGSRDTRGTAGYKATDAGWSEGYYGVYGVPVIYGEFQATDAISTLNADVTVESRLYATQGPALVYTLKTTARGIESRDEGFAALTMPIADRLRADRLIH
jgi:hypothetical protein